MKLLRYLCRCGDRGALNGSSELVKALIVKQLSALYNDTFPACVAIACNCTMVFSFLDKQLVEFMWSLHFWIQIKLSHYVPFDDVVHLTTIAGEKRESQMWHKKQCVGKIMRLRKCYIKGNH